MFPVTSVSLVAPAAPTVVLGISAVIPPAAPAVFPAVPGSVVIPPPGVVLPLTAPMIASLVACDKFGVDYVALPKINKHVAPYFPSTEQ